MTPRYRASLKSSVSDELLNTYLIRPLAWIIVRPLAHTPVRPEAVVGLNITLAAASAAFFFQGTESGNFYAGLLLLAKILFDAVDGQLARAKGQVTRFGRFLDSFGDFYTNLLIFAAIGVAAMRNSGGPVTLLLWLTCFWAMTLQCSYFNYYFIAFLQQSGRRPASRLDEGIRLEDRSRSAIVLWLQRLYLWTYGWQDDLVAVLERATGRRVTGERRRRAWYGDSGALRISSFLGLGTLLMPLALLAIMDQLSFYLLYVFVVSDLVLLGAIIYRAMLAKRLIEIE